MERLRVGVVGAGGIAAEHIGELALHEEVDIVGVCDLDRSRAEALAPSGARACERWMSSSSENGSMRSGSARRHSRIGRR